MSEDTSQSRRRGVRPTALDKLVAQALAIEDEAAAEAGALGFMARALVQATLPHKKVEGNEFRRTNGHFTLTIWAPREIGLPYGTLPRLLMAWLTTEAVRTRERELVLGESLSDFLRQLGLIPSGGAWGSITRLKEQAKRLFRSVVTCSYEERDKSAWMTYSLSDRGVVWWDPDDFKETKQGQRRISRITLSAPFFNEITQHPVPIDLRALKALSRSPLAIDIYCWLTYRMSYLRKPVEIPWPGLQAQFGADYGRLDNFQAAFREQLRKVIGVYPDAKVEAGQHGLVLRPSRTHVAPVDNPVDTKTYPRINGREDVSVKPSTKHTAARICELRAALGKKTTNKR